MSATDTELLKSTNVNSNGMLIPQAYDEENNQWRGLKGDDAGRVHVTGSPTTIMATIANGESLSVAVDLKGFQYFGIYMPGDWTAANLTFQGCNTSGGTFQDIYDDAGNEVTVVAAADRCISVDVAALKLAPWRHIKIRSGTSGVPVSQGAERSIILVVKS